MQQVQATQLSHSFRAGNTDDAVDFFVLAKDCLMLVHKWPALFAAAHTMQVVHTDAHQHSVHRAARPGDTVVLHMSGQEAELHIASVVYDDYPDEDRESICMHITLAADGSSSAFTLDRTGVVLSVNADISGDILAALPWKEWQEHVLDFSDVL